MKKSTFSVNQAAGGLISLTFSSEDIRSQAKEGLVTLSLKARSFAVDGSSGVKSRVYIAPEGVIASLELPELFFYSDNYSLSLQIPSKLGRFEFDGYISPQDIAFIAIQLSHAGSALDPNLDLYLEAELS